MLPEPWGSISCWGVAVAPLFIHLLLLGRLPQAVGRAQRRTSTLRFCQRHVGLCWSLLWPRAGAGGTRPWRKPVPAPGCSPAPRTGAFWSSAPSPRAALPGPMLYLGPAAAGPPQLSPLSCCPAGGTWGPWVSVVCVCPCRTRPRGPLYGDALPAGLCTYCKKQLFESCCFGFCFLSPFLPHPTVPSWKGGSGSLGPGSGAGSAVAPACSCSTHFSPTLPCLWKEAGLCAPARSAGTGWAVPSGGSTRPAPLPEPHAATGLGTGGVGVLEGAPQHTRGGVSHWLLLPPASAGPAQPGSQHGRGPPAAPRGTEEGVGAGGAWGVPRALLAVEGCQGAAPHLPSWVPLESPFRC
ncbi:uncharacterized protein LOC108639112 [Manacus vitellinus]|uniref:uncharacterized protein LOC108639112 n=1 Tax=Manacus vitellinus TaxID=328815 RepID=UPI00115F5E70|nr:uncharacterized protein LOC108639112 [Manacus vitellinus]